MSDTDLVPAAIIMAALIAKHSGIPGFHMGPDPKELARETAVLLEALRDQ